MINKSQVSLEYATTYGWAILIMLIIVGSLIYYGNIENSISEQSYCNVGNQFICTGSYLTAEGLLGLKFTNNINDAVTFELINITNFPGTQCIPDNETVSVGGEAKIICDTHTEFNEGDEEVFDTKISFYTKNGQDDLGNDVLFEVYGEMSLETNSELFNKEEYCDKDEDGYWSDNILCGGDDCDDNDDEFHEPKCYNDNDCNFGRVCVNSGDCHSKCDIIPPTESCPPFCMER